MRNRRRWIAYLAIAAGVIFLFVWIAKPFAAAIMACMITYVLVAQLVIRRTGKKLKIVLASVGQCERGGNARFRLRASNASLIPLADVQVVIDCRNHLNGENWDVTQALRVDRYAEAYIDVEAMHSGAIEAVIRDVRIGDPLGIFVRRYELQPALAEHCVMPVRVPVELEENQIQSYDMESFLYSQEQSGSDTSEVFDLRSYRDGDSMKGIHWKLSAKQDELIVKEPGYPIEIRLMILVDKCQELDAEAMDRSEDQLFSLLQELQRRSITCSVGWMDADRGRFELHEVFDTESLQTVVMRSLRSPYRAAEHSSAYHFLEADIDRPWSNYLYITAHAVDTERLEEYGEVIVWNTADFN